MEGLLMGNEDMNCNDLKIINTPITRHTCLSSPAISVVVLLRHIVSHKKKILFSIMDFIALSYHTELAGEKNE